MKRLLILLILFSAVCTAQNRHRFPFPAASVATATVPLIPFADSFATGANLASRWDHSGTWVITGAKAVNTPVTNASQLLPIAVVGDSTIEATGGTWYNENIYCVKVPMTTKGTVQSIMYYTGTSNSANSTCALYVHDVATNRPTTLIAATASLTGLADNSWKEFTYASPPSITADTVWVAMWNSQNVGTKYATDATGLRIVIYHGQNPISWHDPMVVDGTTNANTRYSVYMKVQP
jgi:hypothetical protein